MLTIRIPFLVLIAVILTIPEIFPLSNVSSQPMTSNHGFLLNELSPYPSDSHPWIELINASGESRSPSGLEVKILSSGEKVVVPTGSPICPPGGFVLIKFSQNAQGAESAGDVVIVNFSKPL